MSEMSEENDETYSIVFRALKHPIRRKILNLLIEHEMSFTEVQRILGLDSGHLTYHLAKLQYLVATNEQGKYHLSAFGKAALNLLSNVEGTGKTFKLEEGSRLRPWLPLKPMQVAVLIAVLAIGLVSAGFYAQAFMQTTRSNDRTGTTSSRIQQVDVVSRWVQLDRSGTWSYNLTAGSAPSLLIVETLPSNPAYLNAVGIFIKYPNGLQYSRVGIERESYNIAEGGTYGIQLYGGDAFPTSQESITVWVEITLLQIQTAT